MKAQLAGLALGAGLGVGAALWARRVAAAPVDMALAARAEAAQENGPWQHRSVEVNGVRLHYAEMGSGPLVILLHGFPECWYEWRHVMPELAKNFHVVAPDMRGYNRSEKPRGVQNYRVETLVADVEGLIEALGAERAHVVGHDWGGMVAWYTGILDSKRLDRLVVINAPHPAALLREYKRGEQLLRSYYAFLFQLPLFPEAVGRLVLRRSLEASANPGAFSDDALDVYENGMGQPGATSAMINYYRATARSTSPGSLNTSTTKIRRPTMLLWGMKDFALVPALTEGLEEWVPALRVLRQPDSTHWVVEERPAWVVEKLLDFFN